MALVFITLSYNYLNILIKLRKKLIPNLFRGYNQITWSEIYFSMYNNILGTLICFKSATWKLIASVAIQVKEGEKGHKQDISQQSVSSLK